MDAKAHLFTGVGAVYQTLLLLCIPVVFDLCNTSSGFPHDFLQSEG